MNVDRSELVIWPKPNHSPNRSKWTDIATDITKSFDSRYAGMFDGAQSQTSAGSKFCIQNDWMKLEFEFPHDCILRFP